MNKSIHNDILEVSISAQGAELKSIKYKDIEYLWQGDPTYWKRSSPVLFPIVGRLLDNEYIYDGKTYHLTQHGFARDMKFDLFSHNQTEVVYLLKENEESQRNYPFKFNFFIRYRLIGNKIEVCWQVENTNEKDMYFQIGAHPAFNFLNGSIIEVDKETTQYDMKQTPYIQEVVHNVEAKNILIDDKTFINDAIVYSDIDKVVLKDELKSVTITCEGFPYIGLWTTIKDGKNAPFICLEPWHGIADYNNHNKELINKLGINKLSRSKVFKAKYYIEIN